MVPVTSLRATAQAQIDGAGYTLQLDFNAMCDLEAVTGRNGFDLLDEFEGGKSGMTVLRAVFWAMLQTHHRGLSLEDAGNLLSADPAACRAAIDAAMGKAKPPAPEADAGNPPAPTAQPSAA